MTRKELAKPGVKATTLVRVVALLGFGACAVMLGIVTWTLSNIRSDREQLDALQGEMTRLVTSVDSYQIQVRDDINALLDRQKVDRLETTRVKELSNQIRGFKARGEAYAPSVVRALNQLEAQLSVVDETRARCLVWNQSALALNEAFPLARKQVRSTLDKMRTAVISTEGQIRLARALQIRQFREAGKKGARTLANKIIADMSRGGDISTGKTELADLALLCERLLAEDNIDHLADLKDNEFRSTLDRLHRVFGLLEESNLLTADAGTVVLAHFQIALFGQGYLVDSVGQTIAVGKDGLYVLCKDRLALRLAREKLQTEVLSQFHALNVIRQELVDEVEAYANETAASAESVLGQAWQTMLIVGLVSMVVFLALSARIAKTVRYQILAIEDTNRHLKKEIAERERVEKALRGSQEALRRAKEHLEIRVEERTSDLKTANAQLEREVSEKNRAQQALMRRGEELSDALATARLAQQTAEEERDRSAKMLMEVSEAKRRLEILISDATARETRMVELKREVNDLLTLLGEQPRYGAPARVEAFLDSGENPQIM